MAKDKKAFVAYCDWLESFEELTNEEAGKLIKHLLRYVNDQNPEPPDRLTQMCFIPIKQSLKRDLRKYEERAERSRLNGAKGGRPKTQKTQWVISEPKKPDSVNGSVSDSVNDNVNDKIDISIHPLLQWIEENTPRVQQLKEPMTQKEADRLMSQFELDYIKEVLSRMHNYKQLTSKVVSANLTFRNWARKDSEKQSNGKQTRADQALANIASGANKELDKIEGLGSF
jgi:hypothetical protein